ncbi:MAG TPA: hypothetical protein VLU99_03770 [Nitrososphaerales archaeon]|nr:hypothetical protein [Nitrososphaerales archaeon]HUK74887.1 hypothetical protein [Nitrososphaerales archaeon]
MEEVESRPRARVIAYTSALIIAIASTIYLSVVPFLPAPPVVPALVGVGLGGLSLRNRGVAVATLYLLVYFSVLWQMIGFGFFQLLSAGVGLAVIVAMAVPLLPFMVKRVELTSMALSVMAVSLMLTPAWFVSIPLIAAAAFAFGSFASLEAIALTYLFFLTPFLLLENALYFTTTTGATAPIVFGQFTALAQNLRPPLPGLNVLLTGLPADYLSKQALPVSNWLATDPGVLVIPMVILGVILVAASSVGVVTQRLIERFEKAREMRGPVKLVLAPLVVAVVTPAVFIVLVTLLSRPESGGFQTSLTNDPSHLQAIYMLGSSFLLTTSFIGRESLILRLESVQVGTEGLEKVIDYCLVKMEDAQKLIDTVARRVPSLSLSAERQAISEYSSHIADVRRQIAGASTSRILEFQKALEETILQPLSKESEVLTQRVANELRGLISATATANSHLEEAGVPLRYPDIPGNLTGRTLEELMSAYDAATSAIRQVTGGLADLYVRESAALDSVMHQQEVNPPVSASVLLSSNEFVGAMRLVAEEYWLQFHLRWTEPLEQKKAALLGRLKALDETIGEAERPELESVVSTIGKARPATSTVTLEALQRLCSMLGSLVTRTASGADRVGSMLESLDLKAARMMKFETTNRLSEVIELKKKLESVEPNFDSVTKFLEAAADVLRSQALAWRTDRDNLVTLAQYPLAKKIIDDMFAGKKELSLSKLPFQRKAAALYGQLYATGTPGVELDDEGETLVVREEIA